MKTSASVLVRIQLYNRHPWLEEAIAVGDSETIRQGDKDQVIAKIVKKSSRPARVMVPNDSGVQFIDHPSKKDITLTVELHCKELKDGLCLKDKKVMIGESITIKTEKTRIEGVISDIQTVSTKKS